MLTVTRGARPEDDNGQLNMSLDATPPNTWAGALSMSVGMDYAGGNCENGAHLSNLRLRITAATRQITALLKGEITFGLGIQLIWCHR